MNRNTWTFLMLIVLLGSFAVLPGSATQAPEVTDSLQSGGLDAALALNLAPSEYGPKQLPNSNGVLVAALGDHASQTDQLPKMRASFPETPILLLLAIGLFGIAVIRRRSFPPH